MPQEGLHPNVVEQEGFDAFIEELVSTPCTAFEGTAYAQPLRNCFSTLYPPIGEPHEGLPMKVDHEYRPARLTSASGTINHIGDLPYCGLRTAQTVNAGNAKILQRDAELAELSVREAIKFYIPDDEFENYLEFFMHTLGSNQHRQAIEKALFNIRVQFGIEESEKLTRDVADALKNPREYNVGDPRKMTIRPSEFLSQAAEDGELLAALVIYQAALISYCEQFRKAIHRHQIFERSGTGAEERSNALHVLNHPLREFDEFFIYSTLATLAVYEKHERTGGFEGPLMPEDISAAWRTFFRTGFLSTHVSGAYKTGDDTEETMNLRLLCPAFPLLRHDQNKGVIERIYKYIMDNREMAGQKTKAQGRELNHILNAAPLIARRALGDHLYVKEAQDVLTARRIYYLGEDTGGVAGDAPNTVSLDVGRAIRQEEIRYYGRVNAATREAVPSDPGEEQRIRTWQREYFQSQVNGLCAFMHSNWGEDEAKKLEVYTAIRKALNNLSLGYKEMSDAEMLAGLIDEQCGKNWKKSNKWEAFLKAVQDKVGEDNPLRNYNGRRVKSAGQASTRG